ncbi:MAG: hypothetical protein GX316_10545 [Firmicutes bacterium]|nr:hypothetical protein [Bacillota bacterium]
MSIKFPDLQILLPRAGSASQIEQQNQRQANISQAQLASEAALEEENRRRHVTESHHTVQDRVREQRHSKQQARHQAGADQNTDEKRDDAQDTIPGSDLGQSIDIRI